MTKRTTNYSTAFWIYLAAFVLMALSFHAEAKSSKTKTETKKEETKKDDVKKSDGGSTVVIVTSKGDITVKLNSEKAPVSTANFLKYVDKKQYDGTIFHRVIKNFMIQGGGFTADMKEKAVDAPIQNEAKNGLPNKRGSIAMARTSDVNSATAQFYINTVDNGMLDYRDEQNYGYAVFGEVTNGMDVVDKIREVATGNKGPYGDVPNDPITIKTIRREK